MYFIWPYCPNHSILSVDRKLTIFCFRVVYNYLSKPLWHVAFHTFFVFSSRELSLKVNLARGTGEIENLSRFLKLFFIGWQSSVVVSTVQSNNNRNFWGIGKRSPLSCKPISFLTSRHSIWLGLKRGGTKTEALWRGHHHVYDGWVPVGTDAEEP